MREYRRAMSLDRTHDISDSEAADEEPKDCMQQSATRFSDMHLASRKAEESALRMSQAAAWLEMMVGPLGLAPDPSEEELRICLRNGLVLCNLINKVHPGAVQKVVENSAPLFPPEGPALTAYQYFENVRNFVVAIEEMKLPSFEASDLEKGSLPVGSLGKVVDCILALKSYWEWRQSGGQGLWKFTATLKSPCTSKLGDQATFTFSPPRSVKNLESTTQLTQQQKCDIPESLKYCCSSLDSVASWLQHIIQIFPDVESEINTPSNSLLDLVITVLKDKPPEKLPFLVEFMLRKVIEEFQHHLCCRDQQLKSILKETHLHEDEGSFPPFKSMEVKIERSREDLKRKFEDPNCASVVEDGQARIQGSQLELEHKDAKQRCLGMQKRNILGLRSAFTKLKEEAISMQIEWEREIKNLDVHIQDLARNAAGYHMAIAENRDLYNQIQDLKGNIRVYCRVRPFLPDQDSTRSIVDFIGETGSLMIVSPYKQNKEQRRIFKFNKVFGPSASQEDIFLDAQPLIRSILDGFNVCIFAYGQTGSGKTHTMSGPNNATTKDLGVNFRALHDLFEISQSRRDLVKYEVGVQMIEIYNEQVKDLLCADGATKKLEIRNNSQQNGLNVPDANMLPVKSSMDVLELMNMGQKNRSIGATALNDRSSRSHSVLTVHVQGTDLATGTVLRGCLHLVDLAGSERVEKSEAVGDRLKEAQHINKSLSALGDVIAALSNKSMHIPYRNSKLTQLLQDSLGGQAKTLMFVHISPEEESYGETMSTLKFAERVASVELGAAQSHRESGEVRELKEQITLLKDVLVKKEAEIKKSQKDCRSRGLDNVLDKSRIKASISPVQSRRVHGYTNCQVAHRQPLEELGNAEVYQSRNICPAVRKPSFIPDIDSEDHPFQDSQIGLPSKHNDNDLGKEREAEILQYPDYQVRSSSKLEHLKVQQTEFLNSQVTSHNHEVSRVQTNLDQAEVAEDPDNLEACRCMKSAERIITNHVNLLTDQSPEDPCLNQVQQAKGDLQLQLKQFSEVADSIQDCSTEDSCGRKAVDDDESSDVSELETLQVRKSRVSPPLTDQDLKKDKLQRSYTKFHGPVHVRRASNQTHFSGSSVKIPSLGASTRLRRFSSMGSLVDRRLGEASVVEAKLAISSEGAVECYAKTLLPRQSNGNTMASKSSKRWL